MSESNYAISFSARLQAATTCAVGNAMVRNSAGTWVVATAANRALYGRSGGLARLAYGGTGTGTTDIQHSGLVPASVITGVGTGTDGQWVRVSTTGTLERIASPASSDDLVGKCNAYGDVDLSFKSAFITSASLPLSTANGGTGMATPGANGNALISNGSIWTSAPTGGSSFTGTGLPHYVAGVPNAAASLVVDADVSGSAAIARAKLAAVGSNTQVLYSGSGTETGDAGFTYVSGSSTATLVGGLIASYVGAGGTLPSAGAGRFANNTSLFWRASGGTNLEAFKVDASDNATLCPAGFITLIIKQDPGGSIYVRPGTADTAIFNANNMLACKPIIGSSGDSSPYAGLNGMFVKAMAGSTYTLAASEYALSIIKVTGSGTNVIKLPAATDAQAYMKYVWNLGTGTLAVQDTNAVAAGATLATLTGALFLFSNASVKQLSAAFTVA